MTSLQVKLLEPLSLSPGVLCCLDDVLCGVLHVRSAAAPGPAWSSQTSNLLDDDHERSLASAVDHSSVGNVNLVRELQTGVSSLLHF